MVVGHQKGKTLKERSLCNYGYAHPEGYRKAMAKMRMAAKFKMPIICFIDTGGAYPGIGAEERGQAQVIASSMFEMSRLPTPIICVVIGEGGGPAGHWASAWAIAWPCSNMPIIRLSVRKACAGIIWKSHAFKEQAAEALKMTAKDLLGFGVIDEIIREPLGGAHRDHNLMANRLKIYLRNTLRELTATATGQLVDNRYQKFRRMGMFLEGVVDTELQPSDEAHAVNAPHLQSETATPEVK